MRTGRAKMLERDQAPSVKPYRRAAAHRGGIWWSPALLCAAAVLLVPAANSSARAAAIRSVSAAAIPPGTGTGPSYCASVVAAGYDLGRGLTSFDNVYPCGPEPGATFPSYGDVFQPSGGFQCTELANRFVFNAWGLQPIFGKSLDGADYATALHAAYPTVLLVPNGIAGQPYLAGDIVSFKGTHTSTADGHVAVVIGSAYDPGDDGNYSVRIMEQNAKTQNSATTGQESLTVTNWALQPASGAWVTPYDFDALATKSPPVGTLSVVAKGIGIPEGLAVDAHGDLFIAEVGTADSGNYVVELTPGGKLSVVAGDGQGESGLTPGPATRSSVDGAGMAVDSQGDLFIADYYRDVVLEVTPARNLSVVAGVFGKAGPPKRGPATSSALDGPVAVAVDARGDLFIADRGNYVVEKVTPAGMLSVVAGIGVYGLTKPGPATRSGMFPIGVAVDASGNLFIADGDNYVVDEVTPAGKLSVVAGVPGKNGLEVPGPATSSDLPGLTAIALDRQGDLFIAENRGVVDEVSRAGELSVVAGDGKVGLPRPGPATKSGLGGLNGVAVDAHGDLFIADLGPTPYGPYSVEKVTF